MFRWNTACYGYNSVIAPDLPSFYFKLKYVKLSYNTTDCERTKINKVDYLKVDYLMK